MSLALTAEDLHWLVCPVCRQALQLELNSIRCTGCQRLYPIVDGIPVLLADRASNLSSHETSLVPNA